MIGVFDSGFGGLTVLKEIVKKNPDYNYIYLGDNARVPYGSRSAEVIYQYTKEAVEFLFKQDCQLVILACNSASALALRRVQQEWLPKHYPDRRVLGVVRPIAEDIVEEGFKRVGVIGTKGTINSNVYEIRNLEIEKIGNALKAENSKAASSADRMIIFQKATPLLVPLIEEDYNNDRIIKSILEEYLYPLKKEKIERLVLACTHYPIYIDKIREVMGDDCVVKNPASIVASKLNDYLIRHKELGVEKGSGETMYRTTDCPDKFRELGERFMGEGLGEVLKVNL